MKTQQITEQKTDLNRDEIFDVDIDTSGYSYLLLPFVGAGLIFVIYALYCLITNSIN